ncbi:MAG: dipicolinate synthase subunit B [Eubacteriales bacterium]|jgi:dipicolinate synthase subunit B|nr:dipicolinate synthase subunit B [Eubacteriales bacterium]
MKLKGLNIGFALTGSFCTIEETLKQLDEIVKLGANVVPIVSEMVYKTDTRFGKAEDWIRRMENATGKKVIHSITTSEPIGPKKMLDVLVVAPCTGNTLSKMANGVNDTSVTMAAKAHLRNLKPVVVAVSTNDGLGANAKNIGLLLNTKNVYFVPFRQDDAISKENSLIADMSLIIPSLEAAINGKQLQPVLIQ